MGGVTDKLFMLLWLSIEFIFNVFDFKENKEVIERREGGRKEGNYAF